MREGNSLRGGAPSSIVTYLMCATGVDAEEALAREYRRWPFDPTADVGVAGTAEDVAAGLTRWIDAGADTVVLQPPVDVDIEGFVRFVGTEVRPLLRGPG